MENHNHTITREELDILIAVQTKNTEQMVTVAASLKQIAEEQKEILHKLSNGIKKEIIDGVKTDLALCNEKIVNELLQVHEMLSERGVVIRRIDANISYTKWFVGIVGLVVVIASVILRGIDSTQTNQFLQLDRTAIEHLHKDLENIQQNK